MMATNPDETLSHPRTRYDSPRMADRRRRVLKFAHQILAEGGVEAMTINRLSELAQVAPSTIYRIFESKEGVIYHSIVEHMDGIGERLEEIGRPTTFNAIEREYDWIMRELHSDPEYGRAVMQLYFGPNIEAPARQSLRSVARERAAHFLASMDRAGKLDARQDLDWICERQVDAEFSVLLRWMQRSLPDQALADALASAFLCVIGPILAEPLRTEAYERARRAHERVNASGGDLRGPGS